jgi:hypothetical protein
MYIFKGCNALNYGEHLRNAVLKLICIKGRNRAVFSAVENKRDKVEKERTKVDRLNLG